MKRHGFSLILSLLLLLTLVQGCDFVRKLAGRPGSERLQELRLLRESELARERAAADSLRAAQAARSRSRSDSLAALQALRESFRVVPLSSLSGLAADSAPAEERFYVVMGSFREKDNAERFSSRLRRQSCGSGLLKLRRGLTLVYAGSATDPRTLRAELSRLEAERILVQEAWILENDRGEGRE